MIDAYRLDLLEIGTPGRLLLTGDIDRVLPLEDAGLLDAANPVSNGRVFLDPARVKVRQEAMVKNLLTGNRKTAVVILGGSHTLTVPQDV